MPRTSLFARAASESAVSAPASWAAANERSPPRSHLRHSMGDFPSDGAATSDLAMELLQRLSAPAGPPPALASHDRPETVVARTDVHLMDIVCRPDGHCEYMMQVTTDRASYRVPKRYSAFRDFRQRLLLAVGDRPCHCKTGPCRQLPMLAQVKFPRRRIVFRRRDADLVVAQERMTHLERFMQATLRVYRMASRRALRCCVNADCPVLTMIRDFLGIDEALPSPESTTTETQEAPWAVHVPQMDSPHESIPMLPLPNGLGATRLEPKSCPPTTRVSMDVKAAKHFEQQQLFPITEDDRELLVSFQ